MGRDYGHQRDYSEDIAADIDAEVRDLIEGAHDEAWEILQQYRDVLDAMVLELVEKETLAKDDLERILAPVPKRPPHNTFTALRQAHARATGRRSRSRRRCASRRPTGAERRGNGHGEPNGNGARRSPGVTPEPTAPQPPVPGYGTPHTAARSTGVRSTAARQYGAPGAGRLPSAGWVPARRRRRLSRD